MKLASMIFRNVTYFDHYQDMRQGLRATRSNMSVYKHVADTTYFALIVNIRA